MALYGGEDVLDWLEARGKWGSARCFADALQGRRMRR
jgi:hypothetical protein